MSKRVIRTLADLPVSEKCIQAGIKQLLELDGWRVFETDKQSRHQDTGSIRHPLGEAGMPDLLCIRYFSRTFVGFHDSASAVMWIECKSLSGTLKTHQRIWRDAERGRGALVVALGVDCPASIDGFMAFYKKSGLSRRI